MPYMRFAGLVILGLAFVAVNPAQSQSLYKKLATIEEQGPPAEKTVKRFRSLVPTLAGKYPESEQQVADITVKGQEILEKRGLSMSLLDVMEGINQVTPSRGTERSYQKIVGNYAVLRSVESHSHDEAILALADEF